MFQVIKLSRALKGFRPFAVNEPKVLEATALHPNETEEASERVKRGTGPKLDERALDRLLLRAEVELSEPDAVQRREAMARLRQAAVSGRG